MGRNKRDDAARNKIYVDSFYEVESSLSSLVSSLTIYIESGILNKKGNFV